MLFFVIMERIAEEYLVEISNRIVQDQVDCKNINHQPVAISARVGGFAISRRSKRRSNDGIHSIHEHPADREENRSGRVIYSFCCKK